jgi:D-alanyl-D-alanine carboxypeptidase/D-alanyl-D-alanine-endopeptidase (penicillin-binding protein 4)
MKSLLVYRNSTLLFIFYFLLLTSCSLQKQISKSATQLVLKDSSLTTAHVGISIYEPATNKYWFNYQGDHYFVPASNTKIPTCYAAMKYLGDSLVGLRYVKDNAKSIYIIPTGDPTFLHPDFVQQPVYYFLNKLDSATLTLNNWREIGLGSGWAWNDYNEAYEAERSAMPIYGNCVTFKKQNELLKYYQNKGIAFDPYIKNGMVPFDNFSIHRNKDRNEFQVKRSENRFTTQLVPFIPNDSTVVAMLQDTLKHTYFNKAVNVLGVNGINNEITEGTGIIHSQPTDSLLKPMMHRSDNFFAEQTLLMVSNERLGVMNDEKIIDTLLKTDFKDLPQKPRWADGSGLSRYNLFTPQDFVAIFNKMKNEFGMDRIKNIFPTGNEGTLSNYYKAENGYLFGKTGSLSGVVALSGFLYTKKNKLLIFSVLVNNHNASATAVRRAVEKFIEGIREKF